MSEWNDSIIKEFRGNEGKVGGPFEGRPLLLLISTGAKSGESRISPVACFPDGDAWLIVASASGSDVHPSWYHNLIANPKARIEIGTETLDVEATEMTGEERDRLFAGVVAAAPQFGEYQKGTARIIPIFRLRRI